MTDAERLVNLMLEFGSAREFFKRPEIAKHPPTIDDVEFKVFTAPENYSEIEGNAGTKDIEAWVKQQLADGNELAWCRIDVRARWTDDYADKTYEGHDYLGHCSYRNRADFIQPGGYYDDMKQQAFYDLLAHYEAGETARDY